MPKKPRDQRTNSELHSDSKTLWYELEMLFGVAQEYTASRSTTCHNACIESFAIHCRALIFFYYAHAGEISAGGVVEKFGQCRDTDVIAVDFAANWNTKSPAPTSILVESKKQADKQIAHITTDRRELNQPGGTLTAGWNLAEICQELAKITFTFLQAVPEINLLPDERQRMKSLISPFLPRIPDPASSIVAIPVLSGPWRTPFNLATDVSTTSTHSAYNLQGRTSPQ